MENPSTTPGTSTRPEFVTLGETMHLLLAEYGVALRRAGTFSASIAGAETNVAVGLSRLGHRTRWLSRVGSDPSGAAVLARLRAEGVDVSAVAVDPQRPTGLLMRDCHATRAIDVQYHRAGSAASALSAAYVAEAGLAGARLVHVTGITAMLSESAGEAVTEFLVLARRENAVISFDPNVRHKLGSAAEWRAAVGPLLPQADLVFAGSAELEFVTGHSARDAVRELLDGQASTVVLKHSDKSAEAITRDGRWRQETLARTVLDPVGAGDALTSGYLSAVLRDATPADALKAGAVSAALVVGTVSDLEGLPNRSESERALRSLTGDHETVDR
jgi:2-dehydro-3-deoxygluconokinase